MNINENIQLGLEVVNIPWEDSKIPADYNFGNIQNRFFFGFSVKDEIFSTKYEISSIFHRFFRPNIFKKQKKKYDGEKDLVIDITMVDDESIRVERNSY
jgi:hypothetical protein